MPRGRILVVDDEPAVCASCVRTLKRSGFDAEAAGSASDALARLDTSSFDLLLTDIKMPDMDGLELLRKARQTDPHLTSVIVTGYGTLNTAIEAIKLGVDGFLLKPFTRDELAASVEGALERTRLTQENMRLRAILPLFEASNRLVVERGVDDLYKTMLTVARQTTEATGTWLVVEPEAKAGVQILPADKDLNLAAALLAGWSSLAGYFEQSRAPLPIRSRQAEEGLADDETAKPSEPTDLSLALSSLREHIASAHCVAIPLLTAHRLIGCLMIERRAPFSESDLEWMTILATQGAAAIQNVWLHRSEQQAIRARDEFLSVAAHELKTPIAVIRAYAELLIDQMPPNSDPTDAAALVAIGRQSANLTRLVEEVLLVSRLQAGELELRLARWDLAELVAEVLAEMRVLNPRHQFVPQMEMHLVIEADRDYIRHVLENLLNNAVRFSPDGGPVQVHLVADGGNAAVSIQDHGLGIPTERQERLFEPFYRAHAGTVYDAGGIGLGLYVCLKLIARHGGRMWLTSEEGIGSTFSFSLPLTSQPLAPTPMSD